MENIPFMYVEKGRKCINRKITLETAEMSVFVCTLYVLCVFPVSGWTPVPAAMCPLGLLPRPSPAGVSPLPPAAGQCVAAVASVPSGAGLLRGAAPQAGHRGLRLRLRHLPV